MAEEKILAEGTTIDVAGSADEKKAKAKQVRYISISSKTRKKAGLRKSGIT